MVDVWLSDFRCYRIDFVVTMSRGNVEEKMIDEQRETGRERQTDQTSYKEKNE